MKNLIATQRTIIDHLEEIARNYFPLFNGIFSQYEFPVKQATWDKVNSKITIPLDAQTTTILNQKRITLTGLCYSFKINACTINGDYIELQFTQANIADYSRTALINGVVVKDSDGKEVKGASRLFNTEFMIEGQSSNGTLLLPPNDFNALAIMIKYGEYKMQPVTIDFTNATLNITPLEVFGLGTPNRLYNTSEYTINNNNLILNINPDISNSSFYDNIKVIDSTKLRVGFDIRIGRGVGVQDSKRTNANFLCLSYEGSQDAVPIGSQDETTRTATIENIKSDYVFIAYIKRKQERTVSPHSKDVAAVVDIQKVLDRVDLDFRKVFHRLTFSVNNHNALLNDSIQDSYEIVMDSDSSKWEEVEDYYARAIVLTVIQDGHAFNTLSNIYINTVPINEVSLHTQTSDGDVLRSYVTE